MSKVKQPGCAHEKHLSLLFRIRREDQAPSYADPLLHYVLPRDEIVTEVVLAIPDPHHPTTLNVIYVRDGRICCANSHDTNSEDTKYVLQHLDANEWKRFNLGTTASVCSGLLKFVRDLKSPTHSLWKQWFVEAFPFTVRSARFHENTSWTATELICELLLMSGHVSQDEIIPHYTTPMILYKNLQHHVQTIPATAHDNKTPSHS